MEIPRSHSLGKKTQDSLWLSNLERISRMTLESNFISFSWLNSLKKFLELNFTGLDAHNRFQYGKIVISLISTLDLCFTDHLYDILKVIFKRPQDVYHRDPSLEELARLGDRIDWLPLYRIDWLPLYRRIISIIDGKFIINQKASSYLPNLVASVKLVRRYFNGSNDVLDVLDTILPSLNGIDFEATVLNICLLCLFLPTTCSGNTNNFSWVQSLFFVWSQHSNCEDIDSNFFSLWGRLAYDQRHDPLAPGFTDENVKTIFSIALKSLDVPVGKAIQSPSLSMRDFYITEGGSTLCLSVTTPEALLENIDKTESFAKFISYTITSSKATMECLVNFLVTIEIFCHPSNTARHSVAIFNVIYSLTEQLVARWNEEKLDDCQIPSAYRLTQQLLDEITKLVLPVLHLGIFGKDVEILDSSQVSLRNLALLSPRIVFSDIIPKLFPALETLTESHRTASAITTLCLLSPCLLRQGVYPEGLQYFSTFLHMTIPGIDLNDSNKTTYTCMFYSHAFAFVPLVECSASNVQEQDDGLLQAIIESTRSFPLWLENFLDAIFQVYENLPIHYARPSSSSSSSDDQRMLGLIESTAEIVFWQLSDDLRDIVLDILARKISNQVIPNASESVGSLITSSSPKNPKKRLEKFVALCCSQICFEIEQNNAGTSAGSSNDLPFGYARMSDATLHWYQEILIGTVKYAGDALLPFAEKIEETLALMTEKCLSKRGALLTSQLLSAYIESLSTTYPKNFSSLSSKRWAEGGVGFDDWGTYTPLDDSSLDWHIPSKEEKHMAALLLSHYLDLAVSQLRIAMVSGEKCYNEMSRWICILRYCLRASKHFLKPRSVGEDVENLTLFSYPVPMTIVDDGWLFTDYLDSDYQHWEKKLDDIHKFLSLLGQYFLEERPDDIEGISGLIDCISDVFSYDFRSLKEAKILKSWLPFVGIKGDLKSLPRYARITERYSILLGRMFYYKRCEPLSSNLIKLGLRMTDFTTTKYRKIRETSQTNLLVACIHTSELCIPALKKTIYFLLTCPLLESYGDIRSSSIKGALYLLLDYRSYFKPLIYEPKVKFLYLKAVMRWATAPNLSDKMVALVQRALKALLDLYVVADYDFKSDHLVLENGLGKIPSCRNEKLVEFSLKHSAISISTHQETIDFLLGLVQSPCHWQTQLTVIQLFQKLVSVEFCIPEPLVRFAFHSIVDEHVEIRTEASYLIQIVFRILKKRAKKSGSYKATSLKTTVCRDDDDFKSVQQGWSCWDKNSNVFVDKHSGGWYIWPKKVVMYKGYIPDGSGPSFEDADSSAAVDLMTSTLLHDDFWNQFCKLNSLEPEIDQESVQLDQTNVNFVAYSVLQYREQLLSFLIPTISRMVATEEAHFQKAGIELIIGVYLGSKYFSPRLVDDVNKALFPILQEGIKSATTESIDLWQGLWSTLPVYRDPKRFKDLFELPLNICLSNEESESDGSYLQLWKLLGCLFIGVSSVRMPKKYISSCLEIFLKHSRSVYGEIREMVGSSIDVCSQQNQLYPTAIDAQSFLNSFKQSPKKLDKISSWIMETRTALNVMSADKDILVVNSCRTLVSLFSHSICTWSTFGSLCFLTDILQLIPLVFRVGDADLQNELDIYMQLLPRYLQTTTAFSHETLAVLVEMLSNTDQLSFLGSVQAWHFKVRLLNVFQIFCFYHIHYLSDSQREKCLEVICDLIGDANLEVRQAASLALSGLLRCSSLAVVLRIKKRFIDQLNMTKGAIQKGTLKDVSLLGKRHTAVLGLCSIILAFPYSIPYWLTDIIVLVCECVNNPSPIQGTVRSTFLEFKRTHQDTWESDKLLFREDELYVLGDLLISPSYYA